MSVTSLWVPSPGRAFLQVRALGWFVHPCLWGHWTAWFPQNVWSPWANRPFQEQSGSVVTCFPLWLRWDFMLLTRRSIVKADSVMFSVGVINLPQPQFPYVWNESNWDNNEELGQVRLAARHPPPAGTQEHMFPPQPRSAQVLLFRIMSCHVWGFFSLFLVKYSSGGCTLCMS